MRSDQAARSTFRPDIQGLRAIAVLLVVFGHAGIPFLAGGYVGVDVFFVLSGFLITDLLLREREKTGSTSLLRFYARRVRRILPVATLVLVVTVVAAYQWLGFLRGAGIARDVEWASLFAANLHYAAEGTNYLNSNSPPSVVQHFWSLAVEEQFYLVWPALFSVTALALPRRSLRRKLSMVLAGIAICSYFWSVVQTDTSGTWAFFSPLTRAWELSIGGLLAVIAPALLRAPRSAGVIASGLGVACIAVAAFIFNASTTFPGYLVALPVIGTMLAVGGGSIARDSAIGSVLARQPFQLIGDMSYSIYLWHWPVLTIAAQYVGRDLPLLVNLALLGVVFALSFASYHLVENPVRYSKYLSQRRRLSVGLGICLVLSSFGIGALALATHPSSPVITPVEQ